MQTSVSILHSDYSPRVREAVERELAVLAERTRGVIALRARLAYENGAHRVELVASVAHAPTLVAQARSDSLGLALDAALERMERLLRRPGQRRKAMRRRSERSSSER